MLGGQTAGQILESQTKHRTLVDPYIFMCFNITSVLKPNIYSPNKRDTYSI